MATHAARVSRLLNNSFTRGNENKQTNFKLGTRVRDQMEKLTWHSRNFLIGLENSCVPQSRVP